MKTTTLSSAVALAIAALSSSAAVAEKAAFFPEKKPFNRYFERVATFPVYKNLNLNDGDQLDDQTAAEISAASQDGTMVYYSNSPKNRVGLIDITNPAAPVAGGFIALDGEPTSVAVKDDYLLVAVNTSTNFVSPSGKLAVYDISTPSTPTFVTHFDMQGQPDAIAVSPNGHYIAVAVENERDEDLDGGLIPQQPAGMLQVIYGKNAATGWTQSTVDLTGYAEIAPDDPEPEYVTINKANIAAVTLQENNHIILVDLHSAKVMHHFSAGSTDLVNVDTVEDDIINPVDTIHNRRREPDAITWLKDRWLVTANEGDYEDANGEQGGSRGFTIFNIFGSEKFESGSSMEHEVIRAGHYPESRSENKGIEAESVISAHYGLKDFLFVGSERGNVVAVYDAKHTLRPELHQLLPTTVGPEGILTIPSRNLLVVSSEEDAADDGIRSTVSIYQYGAKMADYPQIQSDPKQLIPWGALSGMVADNSNPHALYAVPDSYYAASRIFSINSNQSPAIINKATVLMKDGATVDYDLEGIAQRSDGSFWLVSEGNSGSRPNLLILADANGTVLEEIGLPEAVVAKQKSNGFEGVAVTGNGVDEKVWIAFQREWVDDPSGQVRIGQYSPATGSWSFLYYPLDAAQEGAWVGLSEISAINDQEFMVIERDNQSGEGAQIKRLYRFSVADLTPAAEGEIFPVVSKTLVKDILPELQATGGRVLDKVEGTAITSQGDVYVVTDNDGVDDASGETRFIRLGKLLSQ